MIRVLWGVDSSSKASDTVYQCVVKHLGKPKFWGRYLTTVPNASEGLTKDEVLSLHKRGIKVLPIYNAFRQAVGYQEGRMTAQNAIFHLGRLGVPKETFCFGNIEHFFAVDEAWIRGWVDKFFTSGYRPGLYHDPSRGNFSEAYCQAVHNNPNVRDQLVLWSAQPLPGPTKEQDAPSFHPTSPPCQAKVWAWQYGKDAGVCPVDTNLIEKKLYNNLW